MYMPAAGARGRAARIRASDALTKGTWVTREQSHAHRVYVETDVRTFVVGLWDDAREQGRRSVRGDARGLLLLVEQIRHVSN